MFDLDKTRLQKIISGAGITSRRKAEEMINSGHVTVNGKTAQIGCKADPKKDKIRIDGKLISTVNNRKKIYIMLYKPRGYVTTMHDQFDRKCTADLVKALHDRIYPVGRLDRDSEGLLLMTNDGDFSNAVMHPAHHVPKTYRVTIRPAASDEQINKIISGVEIDGRKTSPAEVRIITNEVNREVLEITLHEGRNREIRKICEKLGLEVARLKRISVGNVQIGSLSPGKWRELTANEINSLTVQISDINKNI